MILRWKKKKTGCKSSRWMIIWFSKMIILILFSKMIILMLIRLMESDCKMPKSLTTSDSLSLAVLEGQFFIIILVRPWYVKSSAPSTDSFLHTIRSISLKMWSSGELVLPPPPSFKTVHFAPGVNSGEQEPPPIPTEVTIRENFLSDDLAEN